MSASAEAITFFVVALPLIMALVALGAWAIWNFFKGMPRV